MSSDWLLKLNSERQEKVQQYIESFGYVWVLHALELATHDKTDSSGLGWKEFRPENGSTELFRSQTSACLPATIVETTLKVSSTTDQHEAITVLLAVKVSDGFQRIAIDVPVNQAPFWVVGSPVTIAVQLTPSSSKP